MNTISVEQLEALLQKGEAVPVDTREAYHFGIAHIPGSINMVDQKLEAAAIKAFLPKDKQIILVGEASASIPANAVLEGGFEAWMSAENACSSSIVSS